MKNSSSTVFYCLIFMFFTPSSGSHIENWHSVLRNGLVNASYTKLQVRKTIPRFLLWESWTSPGRERSSFVKEHFHHKRYDPRIPVMELDQLSKEDESDDPENSIFSPVFIAKCKKKKKDDSASC